MASIFSLGPDYSLISTRHFFCKNQSTYSISLYGDTKEEKAAVLTQKPFIPRKAFLVEIWDGDPNYGDQEWNNIIDEFILDADECLLLHRLLEWKGYKEIADNEFERYGDEAEGDYGDDDEQETYYYNPEEEYDRSLDYEADCEDWGVIGGQKDDDRIYNEDFSGDQEVDHSHGNYKEEENQNFESSDDNFSLEIDKLEHTKRKMAFIVKEFLEADEGKHLKLLRDFLDKEESMRRWWYRKQETVRQEDPEYIHLPRPAKESILDADLYDNYGYKFLIRELQNTVYETLKREKLKTNSMRLTQILKWPF